ncbi:MAG: hypothetical protein M9894_18120 [Planctomycetes bacterium]|nr:hypothetical protein [Planctomycetota bacterium]
MTTTIGLIARFRPVHLAHAALLDAVCARAGPGGRVLVGVGSANRYGARNPFTAGEASVMVEAVLRGRHANYALLGVPDLGHGPRWRDLVRDLLGPLDLFVTANPYVRDLLAGVYPLAHPRDLVPRARHVRVSGETVRRAMARGGDGWRHLVPCEVAAVLERFGLVERFRREFGLSTLALETAGAAATSPTAAEEERHVLLG